MRRIWTHITASAGEGEGANRVQFIDAIRGYAILTMLVGHVVGVVLLEEFRLDDSAVYQTLLHLVGTSAPVFVFASGLIVSYLLFKDKNTVNLARAKKSAKRGAQLLLIGFVIQTSVSDLWRLVTRFDLSVFEFLLRSHILHTIGIGIIAIAGLYYLTSKSQAVFPIAAFVLANICFLAGPPVSMHTGIEGVGRVLVVFVSKKYAYFPLLPWLGFSLFGACTGYLAAREKRFMSLLAFILMIAAGFLVRKGAWFIMRDIYELIGVAYTDELQRGSFAYYRLGETLMISGIFGVLTRYFTMPSFLLKSGSETLSIYVLHCVVVYSALFDFGLTAYWVRVFPPLETILLSAVITIGFIVYAYKAEYLRGKFPPLRWIK